MSKLISIIVPVYNVEKYLNQCIESLINQTYRNLEIILINDGSTDRSGEICNWYKNKDHRIKVIHKKNGGLSSARNSGLDIATGYYIGFVDSDDFVEKTMYEKLYLQIENNNADMIKCNLIEFRNNQMPRDIVSSGNITTYTREDAIYNFIYDQYKYNKHFKVVVWDALYKRELLENIRFPEGLLYEDGYVSPKLFFKSKKLLHLDDCLYYYRINDEGIMSKGLTQQSLKSIDDWKEIHLMIKDEIPSCSEGSAYKWLIKYLTIYRELLYRNDIDTDGYYKNYIIKELKINRKYFKQFKIGKRLKLFLEIINFNENLFNVILKNNIVSL